MKLGILAASLLAGQCSAFYLPGIAAVDYRQNDVVPVNANRLESMYSDAASENSIAGVDYYKKELQFCKPGGGEKAVPGSLGSMIFGDRLYTTPYEIRMLKNESCVHMCSAAYKKEEVALLQSLIKRQFGLQLEVDGLPIAGMKATESKKSSEEEVIYGPMIPFGQVQNDKEFLPHYSINNHLDITVEYHAVSKEQFRVVGAYAVASSRANNFDKKNPKCDKRDLVDTFKYQVLASENDKSQPLKVTYSYSVTWVESSTPWATRWDKYLHVWQERVNWFALLDSAVLIVLLLSLCSLALTRTLRKDIHRYNEDADINDIVHTEVGWKTVHGDVFRAPSSLMLYSVLNGSGIQILIAIFASVLLAAVGLLSPASRGAFSTALLLCLALSASASGMYSNSIFKYWNGENWQLNLIATPLVFPGFVFALFLLLNALLISKEASGAVPFSSICMLLFVWLGISWPLGAFTGLIARRAQSQNHPVKTNQIPRQIPHRPWYYSRPVLLALAGILPFISVALQLYYIVTSLWFSRIYYMFGFLLGSLVTMTVTAGATTILVTYFLLNREDYNWQWTSFMVGGSSAFYVFLYCVYYMMRHMSVATNSGTFIYAGYCAIGSTMLFIALGSVGSLAASMFIKKIYTSIKLD